MSLSISGKHEAKEKFAQIGLIAKGFVYTIIGVMAFMAAFELGGQSEGKASRSGAMEFIDKYGGVWVLGALSAGLICYCIWRFMEAFSKKSDTKFSSRLRYFFSGLTYGSVAYACIQLIVNQKKDNGDQNQQLTNEALSQPMGEWMVGLAALGIAAVGIYQLYYGLSEKYKKHVQGMNLQSKTSTILLRSGKVGYIARGIVWLIISFLLFRAAINNSSAEAGGTGEAFKLIENGAWGSYILGVISLGVIAYGFFNFLRARYEKF